MTIKQERMLINLTTKWFQCILMNLPEEFCVLWVLFSQELLYQLSNRYWHAPSSKWFHQTRRSIFGKVGFNARDHESPMNKWPRIADEQVNNWSRLEDTSFQEKCVTWHFSPKRGLLALFITYSTWKGSCELTVYPTGLVFLTSARKRARFSHEWGKRDSPLNTSDGCRNSIEWCLWSHVNHQSSTSIRQLWL